MKAGSEEAEGVKQALIEAGMWSQYLEVGIGPDAEVFTKAQPMSSVGWGADVGLHPVSKWNNPEPEIVLAVNSLGAVKGATLGNDLNLRDVEGRSALLLGKAKDNNASSAIGPFIRLFDDVYGDLPATASTAEINDLKQRKKADVESFVRFFDANSDGKISFAEFCRALGGAELHREAAKVLIEYIADIERATEFSERVDEPEVWTMLGKAQLVF